MRGIPTKLYVVDAYGAASPAGRCHQGRGAVVGRGDGWGGCGCVEGEGCGGAGGCDEGGVVGGGEGAFVPAAVGVSFVGGMGKGGGGMYPLNSIPQAFVELKHWGPQERFAGPARTRAVERWERIRMRFILEDITWEIERRGWRGTTEYWGALTD